MVCCLFGHKETPASIAAELGKVIDHLIQERGVDEFPVGNQGAFDRMVHRALREARNRYPHISYHVVLAYLPNAEPCLYEYSETYFPEGIENVPPRFAISWRNQWMVRESDICVCYLAHSWGGAAKSVDYAKKRKKEIINLYEIT